MIKTIGMVFGLLASPINQNAQTINASNQQAHYVKKTENNLLNNVNNNDEEENLIDNPTIVKSAITNAEKILEVNQYITSDSAAISMRSIYKDGGLNRDNLYWVSGWYIKTSNFSTHNFYGEIKLNPDNIYQVFENKLDKQDYGLYVRENNESPTPTDNLYDIWSGYCEFFLKYKHLDNIKGIINYKVFPLENTSDGFMQANLKVNYFAVDGNIGNMSMHLVYDFWNPLRSKIQKQTSINIMASIPVDSKTYNDINGKTAFHATWYGKVKIYINGATFKTIAKYVHFNFIIEEMIKSGYDIHSFKKDRKALKKFDELVEILFSTEGNEAIIALEAEELAISGIFIEIAVVLALIIIFIAKTIINDLIKIFKDLVFLSSDFPNTPKKGLILNFNGFIFFTKATTQ